MMKALIIASVFFLVGCGSRVYTPVNFTILETYNESSSWGCVGTGVKTLMKASDGRIYKVCGYWGKQGDDVVGCEITGGFDRSNSGFSLNCTKDG